VSKPCTPVVHIKIAGKWMFIPLKMVCIGIDPYPNVVKTPCYPHHWYSHGMTPEMFQGLGTVWNIEVSTAVSKRLHKKQKIMY